MILTIAQDGKTEYKSVTVADNATAEEFMDFYLDDPSRHIWVGHVVDQCTDTKPAQSALAISPKHDCQGQCSCSDNQPHTCISTSLLFTPVVPVQL